MLGHYLQHIHHYIIEIALAGAFCPIICGDVAPKCREWRMGLSSTLGDWGVKPRLDVEKRGVDSHCN